MLERSEHELFRTTQRRKNQNNNIQNFPLITVPIPLSTGSLVALTKYAVKTMLRGVRIYCVVSYYITTVLPLSTAFTTLLHNGKDRRNIQLSHFQNSVPCCPRRTLLQLEHVDVIQYITTNSYVWKLCAVNNDDEINDNMNVIQNTTSVTTTAAASNRNHSKKSDEDNTNTEFDWDAFLDTPFFDPNLILNDPNSNPLLKRFASWVQDDYEAVEVIVTATLFLCLIVVAQELLRIQIYGLETYVPFTKGILPGNLF